jgi:hypothetical protein
MQTPPEHPSLGAFLATRLADASLNVAAVVLLFNERGVPVDYSTVWRWFSDGPQGRTPSLRHFALLTEILGLDHESRERALRIATGASQVEPRLGA